MTVEIDLSTALSDDGTTLGVFLHAEDEDRRASLRSLLRNEGAESVTYPTGMLPAEINGCVVVADTTIAVFIGRLYIVGAMQLPLRDLAGVKRAQVFLLEKPFDIKDKTEKNLLAGMAPLEILEKEKHERA